MQSTWHDINQPTRADVLGDAMRTAVAVLGQEGEPNHRAIAPQNGPQTEFRDCRADIAFIGGSVFGGKTWSLTFEPTRHVDNPDFSCVTFRRTKPDIRNPGSLWDESLKMYPYFDAEPREQPMEWIFKSGARVKFDGLQYESDVLSWKSSQITLLQFDQVEEFTEHQFWYMQSRNRSTCGIKPYTRGSCNPLADTWLAAFIQWWWDAITGRTIAERSGFTRWFIRTSNDIIVWADVVCKGDAPEEEFQAAAQEAKDELELRHPGHGKFARSFCFIRAIMTDNPIGVAADPEYESRVRSLVYVEQERLLHENWKIRAAAGLVFNRAWFEIVPAAPVDARRVRYWDKASTSGGGDWTVGTLMAVTSDRKYYIEDVIRGQWGSGEREDTIKQVAQTDPYGTMQRVEREPGGSGLDSARMTIENLAGFDIRDDRPTGQLVVRAQPLAAQAQVGNVKLVAGPWNEAWLREAHAFPTKGLPDDQIASASGAFKMLTAATPLMVA